MLLLHVVAILLAVNAKDSGGSSPARPTVNPLTIPVYLLDEKAKPLPPSAFPKGLLVDLGVIAGQIGGTPQVTVQRLNVNRRGEIQVDFALLIAQSAKYAALFQDPGKDANTLSPAGTRFARISTIASDDSDELSRGASNVVVFWDMRSNSSVVAYYCDRPCTLRGSASISDLNVHSPTPGLAWLGTKKNQRGLYVSKLVQNPAIALVIVPVRAIELVEPTAFSGRQ